MHSTLPSRPHPRAVCHVSTRPDSATSASLPRHPPGRHHTEDGAGEVECGDDPHNAQRVPLLRAQGGEWGGRGLDLHLDLYLYSRFFVMNTIFYNGVGWLRRVESWEFCCFLKIRNIFFSNSCHQSGNFVISNLRTYQTSNFELMKKITWWRQRFWNFEISVLIYKWIQCSSSRH